MSNPDCPAPHNRDPASSSSSRVDVLFLALVIFVDLLLGRGVVHSLSMQYQWRLILAFKLFAWVFYLTPYYLDWRKSRRPPQFTGAWHWAVTLAVTLLCLDTAGAALLATQPH